MDSFDMARGACLNCSKPIHVDGGMYVHDGNGYSFCIPGRPETAITAEYKRFLEEYYVRNMCD